MPSAGPVPASIIAVACIATDLARVALEREALHAVSGGRRERSPLAAVARQPARCRTIRAASRVAREGDESAEQGPRAAREELAAGYVAPRLRLRVFW